MSEYGTGERAQISIDDASVFVARDEDIEALKRRFEDAARNGPRFVEFRTAGGSTVCALITSRTRIVVTVHRSPAADVGDVVSGDLTDWDL